MLVAKADAIPHHDILTIDRLAVDKRRDVLRVTGLAAGRPAIVDLVSMVAERPDVGTAEGMTALAWRRVSGGAR